MLSPAAKLLQWYDKHGRDLPWRKTRNPYKILVSEIMLQQTQVPRVMVFYEKWLKQFPDWSALAKASNAQVIRMWSGLGYNRRALVLRDIAKQVVETPITPARTTGVVRSGGQNPTPNTESYWRSLKGIGPYTSAAIAAFAFKQRTIPVDTNIRRVLARLLLGIPYPDLKDDERIRAAADLFLPRRGRFYDVPQALFDLATAVCTKTPSCASCPLRKDCKTAERFLSGRIETPKRAIQKSPERKHRDKPHPDRIYRGRILRLVQEQPGIQESRVGAQIDPSYTDSADKAWLHAMIDRLAKDSMVKRTNGKLYLA